MLGIEPRVSHMLSTSSTTGLYTPAPKRTFLRQEYGVGRGGLSLLVEVIVGCKRCRWMDRQTRCQGNEERLGQKRTFQPSPVSLSVTFLALFKAGKNTSSVFRVGKWLS